MTAEQVKAYLIRARDAPRDIAALASAAFT